MRPHLSFCSTANQGFLHNDNDNDDDDEFDDDHQGTLSGDIHFDDDEDWTVGSERGTDVIQVVMVISIMMTQLSLNTHCGDDALTMHCIVIYSSLW